MNSHRSYNNHSRQVFTYHNKYNDEVSQQNSSYINSPTGSSNQTNLKASSRFGKLIHNILVSNQKDNKENNSYRANNKPYHYRDRDYYRDSPNYYYESALYNRNVDKPLAPAKENQIQKVSEFCYLSEAMPRKRNLLIIKVKFLTSEKTIEISNYDNIYAKAYQFCFENSLGFQFVLPICNQIVKALQCVNGVLDSQVDGEFMESIKDEFNCMKDDL
jgi:hypothetical protein